MGASNFARPENASKYFVVLTNTEEKFVKCNDCNDKHYEYEEEYEAAEGSRLCLNCGSDNLEWDEEYRSPEEWEIEDLKSNLFSDFEEKIKTFGESNYRDTSRNYHSSPIGEYIERFYIGDVTIDIKFTIIITSAYYEGATLDFLIEFDIDNYTGYDFDQVEELTIEDLYYSEMNEGMKVIQLPNIVSKIKKAVEHQREIIEGIFSKYSDQYARLGGFSDGTSVYVKA